MAIKPINNEQDYNEALERLEVIFDAEKGTDEGNELEALAIPIEKYENELFSFTKEDIVLFEQRQASRLSGESKVYDWEEAKTIITGKSFNA